MSLFRCLILLNFLLLSYSCKPDRQIQTFEKEVPSEIDKAAFIYDSAYIAHKLKLPVGKPAGKGYYNAQKFGSNNHLGEDWNAVTGGNTDLGDPIYAIASGFVKDAQDYGGGWGKVIQLLHRMPDSNQIVSLYAHCDTILVQKGDYVNIGDQIGTIGNAHGAYLAHLHFELRSDTLLPVGGGYSEDTTGYLNPTEFIEKHR